MGGDGVRCLFRLELDGRQGATRRFDGHGADRGERLVHVANRPIEKLHTVELHIGNLVARQDAANAGTGECPGQIEANDPPARDRSTHDRGM